MLLNYIVLVGSWAKRVLTVSFLTLQGKFNNGIEKQHKLENDTCDFLHKLLVRVSCKMSEICLYLLIFWQLLLLEHRILKKLWLQKIYSTKKKGYGYDCICPKFYFTPIMIHNDLTHRFIMIFFPQKQQAFQGMLYKLYSCNNQ